MILALYLLTLQPRDAVIVSCMAWEATYYLFTDPQPIPEPEGNPS